MWKHEVLHTRWSQWTCFQKRIHTKILVLDVHGEEDPSINLNEHVHSGASNSHQGCNFGIPSSRQSNILQKESAHVNRYQGMVYDAAGIEFDHHIEPNVEESPNQTRWYNKWILWYS